MSRGRKHGDSDVRIRAQKAAAKGAFLIAIHDLRPDVLSDLAATGRRRFRFDEWAERWSLQVDHPGAMWLRIWAWSRRRGRVNRADLLRDGRKWLQVVAPDVERTRRRGAGRLTRLEQFNIERDCRWWVLRHFNGATWRTLADESADAIDRTSVRQAVARVSDLLGLPHRSGRRGQRLRFLQ